MAEQRNSAVEIDSPVAELQAITKLYKPRSRRASPIHAVDGVDLELRTGETLGLVGESGSGKSTVARLLLRLVEPTSGRVMLGRSDITAIRGAQLPMTPMTVAPTGVLPTNAVDHRAVTRPRMSGRAAIWMVLFPVVRNMMLAAPTTISNATAR